MAQLYLSLLLVLGCVLVNVVQTLKQNETTGFALASNYFGLNLLNKLSEKQNESSSSNLFFSPYSISLAIAMLYQGSSGSTAQQLEAPLGYQLAKLNSSDKNVLAQQVRSSDDVILLPQNLSNSSNTSSKYVLNSGNALIVDKQFPILETYTQNLQNNFGAELFSVDFANAAQEALTLINQWVSNRTYGKIPTLLSKPLPRETQLALVNAVYFQGTWERVFQEEETISATFKARDGSTNPNVRFMCMEAWFKITHLNEINVTLLEMPYKGSDLSMFAFLSNDTNSDLKFLKQKLTPNFIDSAISKLENQEIRLRFPKFDFKSEYDLVDALKDLGITEIFDVKKANFSDLSSSGKKLAVGVVKHSATIEVNERGSEASGATIVEIVEISEKIIDSLYFDHPFLFFIRHNQNGQILFIEEVNKL